ncbi:hypothetical protein D3C76_1779640 [compost metagenome]
MSVRTPGAHVLAADAFCRGFATGGGRARAAGINHLPTDELGAFAETFERFFGRT